MRPRWRAWLFSGAVAALGSAIVAPAIDLAGVAPDFATIATVALALARGAAAGTVGGFALGLLQDLAAPQRLGLRALLLCLVGFASGRLRERLVTGLAVVEFGLIGLAVLIPGTVLLVTEGPTGRPLPLLTQVVPTAVYSGLVGTLLLRLADRLGAGAQDD